jgi:hypothetical protein
MKTGQFDGVTACKVPLGFCGTYCELKRDLKRLGAEVDDLTGICAGEDRRAGDGRRYFFGSVEVGKKVARFCDRMRSSNPDGVCVGPLCGDGKCSALSYVGRFGLECDRECAPWDESHISRLDHARERPPGPTGPTGPTGPAVDPFGEAVRGADPAFGAPDIFQRRHKKEEKEEKRYGETAPATTGDFIEVGGGLPDATTAVNAGVGPVAAGGPQGTRRPRGGGAAAAPPVNFQGTTVQFPDKTGGGAVSSGRRAQLVGKLTWPSFAVPEIFKRGAVGNEQSSGSAGESLVSSARGNTGGYSRGGGESGGGYGGVDEAAKAPVGVGADKGGAAPGASREGSNAKASSARPSLPPAGTKPPTGGHTISSSARPSSPPAGTKPPTGSHTKASSARPSLPPAGTKPPTGRPAGTRAEQSESRGERASEEILLSRLDGGTDLASMVQCGDLHGRYVCVPAAAAAPFHVGSARGKDEKAGGNREEENERVHPLLCPGSTASVGEAHKFSREECHDPNNAQRQCPSSSACRCENEAVVCEINERAGFGAVCSYKAGDDGDETEECAKTSRSGSAGETCFEGCSLPGLPRKRDPT